MKRIIFESSLRGTVASSRIVVGDTRASALNAERRALARRMDSSAVCAICTFVAPQRFAISTICAA